MGGAGEMSQVRQQHQGSSGMAARMKEEDLEMPVTSWGGVWEEKGAACALE